MTTEMTDPLSCPVCGTPLEGKKKYCTDKCRLWAHHEKKAREFAEMVYQIQMQKHKRPERIK
jgi:predicted nucleic acid-binding Zn ribbon protein